MYFHFCFILEIEKVFTHDENIIEKSIMLIYKNPKML